MVLQFPTALATVELVSSMPVNGTFYWWSAALAPTRFSRFAAFSMGWLVITALMTGMASLCRALATWICVSAIMLHPEFVPTNPQLLGVSIGILVLLTALFLLRMERMVWIFMATGMANSLGYNPIFTAN